MIFQCVGKKFNISIYLENMKMHSLSRFGNFWTQSTTRIDWNDARRSSCKVRELRTKCLSIIGTEANVHISLNIFRFVLTLSYSKWNSLRRAKYWLEYRWQDPLQHPSWNLDSAMEFFTILKDYFENYRMKQNLLLCLLSAHSRLQWIRCARE